MSPKRARQTLNFPRFTERRHRVSGSGSIWFGTGVASMTPMKQNYTLLSLSFILSIFTGIYKLQASNVILQWNASPSPSVAGYNVYYGTIGGNLSYKLNAGNTTSAVITNLTPNSICYFFATSYDKNGHESLPSAQINYSIPYTLSLVRNATTHGLSELRFDIQPLHAYEIQASSDLKNWTSIWQSNLILMYSTMQYVDPDPGPYTKRYYRLVVH
jgi:hypothetical protein